MQLQSIEILQAGVAYLRRAAVLLAACILATGCSSSPDNSWALAYEGKDSESFLYDPQVVALITRDLAIPADGPEMAAFHGVPAPVTVLTRRYVWSSSCEAHECPFNRGFFWLDTATGETLVAHAAVTYTKEEGEHHVLTLGGSQPSASAISPEGMQVLRGWITTNQLSFDRAQYRADGSAAATQLDPAQYSAPAH